MAKAKISNENSIPWAIGEVPCNDLPTANSKICTQVLKSKKKGLTIKLIPVLACCQRGRENTATG